MKTSHKHYSAMSDFYKMWYVCNSQDTFWSEYKSGALSQSCFDALSAKTQIFSSPQLIKLVDELAAALYTRLG